MRAQISQAISPAKPPRNNRAMVAGHEPRRVMRGMGCSSELTTVSSVLPQFAAVAR